MERRPRVSSRMGREDARPHQSNGRRRRRRGACVDLGKKKRGSQGKNLRLVVGNVLRTQPWRKQCHCMPRSVVRWIGCRARMSTLATPNGPIKGFVGVRYAMPWNIRFLRLLDIVSVAASNRNTLLVWAYKRTCSWRCSLVIPREFPSIGRMFSVLLLRCTYQL